MTDLSLAQVVRVLEDLYPLRYAEDWDEPGLVVGDVAWPVRKIYCAVDPTLAVVEEAVDWGADLLLTHHPLFFRSVHQVSGLGFRGAIVNRLVGAHCGLWAGHTNADAAYRGVSQALADALGVQDQVPLVPIDDPSALQPVGIGRVGQLPEVVSLADFAQRVADCLPLTQRGIDVSGDLSMPVRRVAVLGGAGDSLFDQVRASQADVYLTSDLRHHPMLDARQQADYEAELRVAGLLGGDPQLGQSGQSGQPGQWQAGQSGQTVSTTNDRFARPALINTPHYASERLWFSYALADIPAALSQGYPDAAPIAIKLSPTNTDPVTVHLGPSQG